MMIPALRLNDLLSFLLEMGALILWGRWAFDRFDTAFLQVGAAFILVVAFALIWGAFFAPRAKHPLPKGPSDLFKLALLGAPALPLGVLSPVIPVAWCALVGLNLWLNRHTEVR